MLKHNQRHHPKVTFACRRCPKRFGVKADLPRHLATHGVEVKDMDLLEEGMWFSDFLPYSNILLTR